MTVKKTNYSIFDKFKFERKPVGVKFSLGRPEGIKPTDKLLAICELINEAQTGRPFYVTVENIQCGGGVIGLQEYPPMMYSGQLGPMFSMFKTPGANRRIYDYVPHLPKDSIKYVSCARLDRMNFEPDLLIFTANVTQAEIVLRASSFSDGKMWHSKGTTCLACAWIYRPPLPERRDELYHQWPRLQYEGEKGVAGRTYSYYVPLRRHFAFSGKS